MALTDSKQAIGAVGEFLISQLTLATSANTVDIGRPQEVSSTNCPKFNIFLYQIDFDGQLRNLSLDEGQRAPLWIVLHYLLTAFDENKESDTSDAHSLLGEGMLALNEMNFIESSVLALADNPEPLKITFDGADSELLSKIMQGSDEKYRLSTGFQVRPVMIAPSVPPSYALPVKTIGPPAEEGVALMPSLGPKLETVSPEKFAQGETITLTGVDVGTEIEQVRLGNIEIPVTAAKTGEIQAVFNPNSDLSAGSYPITAIRTLKGNQVISSNAVLGTLLPTLNTATPGALTESAGRFSGDLTLTGELLGGPDDSIFIAFYRDGEIALMLEGAGALDQTTMTVNVDSDNALPAGNYFIILRVNGAQAVNAPTVDWS